MVSLVNIATPVATPASPATPHRSKRREARIAHTLTATAAACMGSTYASCASDTIIGAPRANTTASSPARGPDTSRPTP